MIPRIEIKEYAKTLISARRSHTILLTVLPLVISAVAAVLLLIPIIGHLIDIVVSIAMTVLSVSLVSAFVAVYRQKMQPIQETLFTVMDNFLRKLGGMLWMALFAMLWSMLFVIPGVVKSISYSMTPYILAEYPNVTATDALKISMRMTRGYKMDIFIFSLSFLGWALLSGVTFGIAYIVYVGPYMSTSSAGMYEFIKDRALESGAVSEDELGPQYTDSLPDYEI